METFGMVLKMLFYSYNTWIGRNEYALISGCQTKFIFLLNFKFSDAGYLCWRLLTISSSDFDDDNCWILHFLFDLELVRVFVLGLAVNLT